ncbi:recombinase family protein [Microbacterium trichothecenolyticum]
MIRVVGYARAAPGLPGADDAIAALRDAGARRVFVDSWSRSGTRREFDRCMKLLTPGDTLLVVNAASLASTVGGFVKTASMLRARGIHLRSLTEPALSSSPTSDEVLTALEGVRRQLIGIRTREGMDAASAAGRRPGRPRVMTAERIAVARELRAQKRSFAQIGLALGVSEAAVRRALRTTPAENPPQSVVV